MLPKQKYFLLLICICDAKLLIWKRNKKRIYLNLLTIICGVLKKKLNTSARPPPKKNKSEHPCIQFWSPI